MIRAEISTFGASGALDLWYIDLIGRVRRTPVGFDYPEHDLERSSRPDERQEALSSGVG